MNCVGHGAEASHRLAPGSAPSSHGLLIGHERAALMPASDANAFHEASVKQPGACRDGIHTAQRFHAGNHLPAKEMFSLHDHNILPPSSRILSTLHPLSPPFVEQHGAKPSALVA